jgi:MinD superfamily P-loop ATPase
VTFITDIEADVRYIIHIVKKGAAMTAYLPDINEKLCSACGLCIEYCPTQAVGLIDLRPVFLKPDACSYCGMCEEICPAGAINLAYTIQLDM